MHLWELVIDVTRQPALKKCAEELSLYEDVSTKIEELLPQVLQGDNPSVNIIIGILTKNFPALPDPSIYIVWHSKLGVFMKKLADQPNLCIKNCALPIFERFNALLSEPGRP